MPKQQLRNQLKLAENDLSEITKQVEQTNVRRESLYKTLDSVLYNLSTLSTKLKLEKR